MNKGKRQFWREPKSRKFVKYLEKTQIEEILERAKKDNKRNYLILLTLWRTGIRSNELTNLKKRDIKDNHIMIHQGKGNVDRIVPIDNHLLDLLSYHMGDMAMDDKLFPLTNSQIRNIVHKYQGADDVHPHTFRHSFSVHCLKSGMNIRVLQKILGHTSLDTTQIYLDIVAKDVIEDYQKVEW